MSSAFVAEPQEKEIMETIEVFLEQYELNHGHLCPGALLALRMAVLGCALVDIEDPRGADLNKLIVWVEIDRWLADAVEAVTGARLGRRTLKFLDYGKPAATFLNVETGKAVRIVAIASSRRLADLRHPEIESKYARQMQTYREAAQEELFEVVPVEIHLSEQDAPGRPRFRVICSKCAEEVNDGREINAQDGSVLCRPCAFDILARDRRGLVNVEVNGFYPNDLHHHEREQKLSLH
jgi:formylmethanofuran dehydrogenase subunit E